MGSGSRQPFLFSLDFLKEADRSCHFTNRLGSRVLEHQGKRRLCSSPGRKQTAFAGTRPRSGRPSRVLFMKRRPRLERRLHATRPANEIERKVRILKKLIPNCCESAGPVGLENLFRETADYISALQLRVKVMQIMVDVLSGSD